MHLYRKTCCLPCWNVQIDKFCPSSFFPLSAHCSAQGNLSEEFFKAYYSKISIEFSQYLDNFVVHQIAHSATLMHETWSSTTMESNRGKQHVFCYSVSFLTHCYSYLECAAMTYRLHLTWELVRNAESETCLPASVYRPEIYASISSPGASYTPTYLAWNCQ